MSKSDKETHPRVFISYSLDSQKHADKVLKFANKLRSEGIDAILDQYEEAPPEGWPKWMDRQIDASDFILLVCTENYYQKVMGAVDEGLGVKWESTLAYQYLYDAGAESTRFVPVLFKGGSKEHIPKPVAGFTRYCVENTKDYENLYRRLTGQPKTKKTELGKLKSLGERKPMTRFFPDAGGEGGGGGHGPDDSERDSSKGKRGRFETLYHLTVSAGTAVVALGVIYQMSGRQWKTTCWWSAAVCAFVAGVWAISQMPREPLKFMYRYIFADKKVASIARWAFVVVVALVLIWVRPAAAQHFVAVVECTDWGAPDSVKI